MGLRNSRSIESRKKVQHKQNKKENRITTINWTKRASCIITFCTVANKYIIYKLFCCCCCCCFACYCSGFFWLLLFIFILFLPENKTIIKKKNHHLRDFCLAFPFQRVIIMFGLLCFWYIISMYLLPYFLHFFLMLLAWLIAIEFLMHKGKVHSEVMCFNGFLTCTWIYKSDWISKTKNPKC